MALFVWEGRLLHEWPAQGAGDIVASRRNVWQWPPKVLALLSLDIYGTRLSKSNRALKVQLKTWLQRIWLLLKTPLCHQINSQKEIKLILHNPESSSYKRIHYSYRCIFFYPGSKTAGLNYQLNHFNRFLSFDRQGCVCVLCIIFHNCVIFKLRFRLINVDRNKMHFIPHPWSSVYIGCNVIAVWTHRSFFV